jgi:hypothetical protein
LNISAPDKHQILDCFFLEQEIIIMPQQHAYVGDLIIAPEGTRMEYTRYGFFQQVRNTTSLMDQRLGKSGLKVSKIILGAMSYGSKDWQKWVLEEEDALPLLEHAYKVGINTWDTVSPTHSVFSRPSSNSDM